MTDGPTGSTVPRRQLGRHLRELRNRSRLTVRTAARELEWSETKLWRIETGQTSLRSLDVEAMCRIYGAPADLAQSLMTLAKETKARGWWHAFGDVIAVSLNLYIGLEDAASELCWYSAELVPGLLQTEDYARAIIQADNARLGEDEVERRVHARVARRALFARVTAVPTVRVALNAEKAILRREVGGREVMARQLEYLLEASRWPSLRTDRHRVLLVEVW
jgi:transcriptional regulator with XRE-family HTH domain